MERTPINTPDSDLTSKLPHGSANDDNDDDDDDDDEEDDDIDEEEEDIHDSLSNKKTASYWLVSLLHGC